MLRRLMTYIEKTTKTLFAALCLSVSAIVPASAADVVFLPDIPADQIARDTVRSFDSQTGVSLVTAPTFDPFEQDNTLAGTAALRTGPSAITIDGEQVVGGAYLDLKMIYTSASDDPFDLRGFEQAYYVSGDPVSRLSQDVRTLDCASNTTEVVYEDNYYNNYNDYGYLAGVYLLLPRYRGHRGYWGSSSRHRPFAGWSDWRHRRGYGSHGGGYYSGYGSRGRGFGYQGRGGRGDRDRGRGGDRRGSDNGGNGGSDNGGRVERADAPRHSGRNAVIGGSRENRSYTRQRGVVTGGPLTNGRADNTRRRESSSSTRTQRDRARGTSRDRNADRTNMRERIRGGESVGRLERGRGSNPLANTSRQPISRTGRPNVRGTVTNRAANPAGSAPRPIARSAPPATVSSRPAPRVQSRVQSKPQQRTERKQRTKPVSKPRESSRKLNREVDRSFRKTNRSSRGRKQMEFFPMLSGFGRVNSSVVTTNYRCVREETVTLHIPQERLDAARFDGMTLVIVDNADRDVPIYLPPNYIEGFRQATGRSFSRYQSGSQYSVPSTTVVTPQPRYSPQGSYPQN